MRDQTGVPFKRRSHWRGANSDRRASPSRSVAEIVRAVRVELTALGGLAGLIVVPVMPVMTARAGLAVLTGPGRWNLAFQLRYALLQFDVLERAQIAIEQLRDVVSLRWCQVTPGNGRRDIRQRRAHAGRAVKRRKLEGNHPITAARRNAVEANADRRRVARLGRLDGRADDVLGLALEQLFGEDRGLAARAFRPAGRISALSRLKGHVFLRVVKREGPPAAGRGPRPRAIA